jgi:hypothetical protein
MYRGNKGVVVYDSDLEGVFIDRDHFGNSETYKTHEARMKVLKEVPGMSEQSLLEESDVGIDWSEPLLPAPQTVQELDNVEPAAPAPVPLETSPFYDGDDATHVAYPVPLAKQHNFYGLGSERYVFVHEWNGVKIDLFVLDDCVSAAAQLGDEGLQYLKDENKPFVCAKGSGVSNYYGSLDMGMEQTGNMGDSKYPLMKAFSNPPAPSSVQMDPLDVMPLAKETLDKLAAWVKINPIKVSKFRDQDANYATVFTPNGTTLFDNHAAPPAAAPTPGVASGKDVLNSLDDLL